MTIPTPPPSLPQAKFSAAAWRESAERRRDPSGITIQHLRWVKGPCYESLPYLFSAEAYAGSIQVAGPAAEYVAPDPEDEDRALFHLLPGAVVVIASLAKGRGKRHYVVLEVIVVESFADSLARSARHRQARPATGLMEGVTSLANLPRYKQREISERGPSANPPEGRDPNG